MNPLYASSSLSRRALLRKAAAMGIALPLLEQMQPARAGEGKHPLRFIVFFSPNGTIHDNWRPTGGERDFRFTQAKPTKDPHILSPLAPHRNKLVVLDGIDTKSRTHGPGANGHDKGMGHMLTGQILKVGPSGIGDFSHLPDGTAGGPSVDQEIARRLGQATRFSSLEFGVSSRLDVKRQLTSRMCYRGPFQVVPPESDPGEMFRNAFAGVGGDRQEFARLRKQRRSVLDRVAGEFRALQAQLGAADRRKLEDHTTAIREVENALEARPGEAAAQCAIPESLGALDHWENDNYPRLGRLQMDLMASALACDLTRVVSLQWSTGQSPVRYTWLGQSESHHGISHKADDTAEARSFLTQIDHWYAQQFSYLLSKLDAIKEGDGTLLDNCLVMWINEQGNGDQHSELCIPYVLAGGCGGRLKTGRYLRYDHASANDLFIALMHLMGFDDVHSFGMKELCSGPLTGLT